jgi:putative membrane protein
MERFLLRWVINAIALYVAIEIVPGIDLPTGTGWTSVIWLALIFGLLNALLRPILSILTCPLIILTLGLFTLVLNTLLFALTGWIGDQLGVGFTLAEPWFWNAFLGALVVSLVSIAFSLIVKEEKKPATTRH